MKPRPAPIPGWLQRRMAARISGVGTHSREEDHFRWRPIGMHSVECLECGIVIHIGLELMAEMESG